jgi:hypothetical protein
MIAHYNPDNDPDPAEWTAMDDGEKISLIADYHKRARIKLPNRNLHAAIHAVVENQIAMNDANAAKETLARLMREGLDRHDAIHAIGSILAEQIHKIMTTHTAADNEAYSNRLRQLSAEAWKQSGQPEN